MKQQHTAMKPSATPRISVLSAMECTMTPTPFKLLSTPTKQAEQEGTSGPACHNETLDTI